jgi:phosphoglycolate phosphatase-like HAD superfamily hydrolase
MIKKYFLSINGSPTTKKLIIKNLIKKFKYKKNETILIDDSINDLEAAKNNKIDFYGYNNKFLKDFSKIHIEKFNHKCLK